ncbi:MAG: radical SAM protein [Ruminococcus sp.]|nr:radical SAM protein [Ruminococcus sp.]
MKHSNISIFIPHTGCPHMCSFCNQHTISGAQKSPSADEVREICGKAAEEINSPENTEIAFFGGSFTAIPRNYMISLLETAHEFVGEGKFRGIRISTRPDYITPDILDILKKYGVTAIELGAQSMSDDVLKANERGHTAQDVINASNLIKKYNFELGLQMMIGLYKSTGDDEWETMKKILEIHPDTVRIYPVVILKGTKLADLLESGEYKLFGGENDERFYYDFEDVVDTAATFLETFEDNGIKVIKCGLHASEFVEKDMVGGYYHPAFRELCEAVIYRHNIEHELIKNNIRSGAVVLAVNNKCISKAVGHQKSNYKYFKENGIEIKIIGDGNIPKYKCFVKG